MNLADEIQKLRELQYNGTLTAAEFEAAKAKLLGISTGPPPIPQVPPPLSPAPAYAPQPAYASPQAAPVSPAVDVEAATRQWAMFLHLSQLAGFIVPLAGMIVPIVIWQIKKKELPGLDAHGCHATNWIITALILGLVCGLLCFILIGIPLFIALGIVGIVFPIIAAVKANNGELWRYPVSFTFFRPQAEAAPPAGNSRGW